MDGTWITVLKEYRTDDFADRAGRRNLHQYYTKVPDSEGCVVKSIRDQHHATRQQSTVRMHD